MNSTKDRVTNRAGAIARAQAGFDDGTFLADLTRRVAIPSSSQEPARAGALHDYLTGEIEPALSRLGFTCRILDNPRGPPVMIAERIEDPSFVTILVYGHGDTIAGMDDKWRKGLAPWQVVVEGEPQRGRRPAQVVAEQGLVAGDRVEQELRRGQAGQHDRHGEGGAQRAELDQQQADRRGDHFFPSTRDPSPRHFSRCQSSPCT